MIHKAEKWSFVENIFSVADKYDLFLLDLWGVVHDGTSLYPGVKQALQKFGKDGKQVIFISNAPRRASRVKTVLSALGIDESLYLEVVSSGEVGYHWLASGGSNWGNNYYYIGPSRDEDILRGLSYCRVYDIKEADFLLNVGFGSEESSADDYSALLQAAQLRNLPMLCLNPDKEVVKITGERYACAGIIGEQYEAISGCVKWFGKPYQEIYAHCLRERNIDKSRILAVGDSLDTDIPGGHNYGIDTLLITGGILAGKTTEKIMEICRNLGLKPDYVAPMLAYDNFVA